MGITVETIVGVGEGTVVMVAMGIATEVGVAVGICVDMAVGIGVGMGLGEDGVWGSTPNPAAKRRIQPIMRNQRAGRCGHSTVGTSLLLAQGLQL